MRTPNIRHLTTAGLVVMLTTGCIPLGFTGPDRGQFEVKPADGVDIQFGPADETLSDDEATGPDRDVEEQAEPFDSGITASLDPVGEPFGPVPGEPPAGASDLRVSMQPFVDLIGSNGYDASLILGQIADTPISLILTDGITVTDALLENRPDPDGGRTSSIQLTATSDDTLRQLQDTFDVIHWGAYMNPTGAWAPITTEAGATGVTATFQEAATERDTGTTSTITVHTDPDSNISIVDIQLTRYYPDGWYFPIDTHLNIPEMDAFSPQALGMHASENSEFGPAVELRWDIPDATDLTDAAERLIAEHITTSSPALDLSAEFTDTGDGLISLDAGLPGSQTTVLNVLDDVDRYTAVLVVEFEAEAGR